MLFTEHGKGKVLCSLCSPRIESILILEIRNIFPYLLGEGCSKGFLPQQKKNPGQFSDNERRQDSTVAAVSKVKRATNPKPLSFLLIYLLSHLINVSVFLAPNSAFDSQGRSVVILVY